MQRFVIHRNIKSNGVRTPKFKYINLFNDDYDQTYN